LYRYSEVLYLPAGWFHEVTSLGTLDTSASKATGTKKGKKGTTAGSGEVTAGSGGGTAGSGGGTGGGTGGGGGHLALNYWFHPPVVGEGGAGDDASAYRFEAPYGGRQRMWERDWAMWEELFAAERK
jgi:hypothetical protein